MIGAAAIAVAMLALSAGPASASLSTATGEVHGSGSLTLTTYGQQPVNCPQLTVAAYDIGGIALSPIGEYILSGACATGRLDMAAMMWVDSGPPATLFWMPGYGNSPFSGLVPAGSAEFVNAAGGQPSKLVFDDTVIGDAGSGMDIEATGTIALNDGNGGNVTIEE